MAGRRGGGPIRSAGVRQKAFACWRFGPDAKAGLEGARRVMAGKQQLTMFSRI
jgi:hypothetical protein